MSFVCSNTLTAKLKDKLFENGVTTHRRALCAYYQYVCLNEVDHSNFLIQLFFRSGKYILPLYREYQGPIEEDSNHDEVKLIKNFDV